MYSRILVPIGGSDTAALGFREAQALSRELHATLVEMAAVSSVTEIHEGLSPTWSITRHGKPPRAGGGIRCVAL